MSRKHSGPRDYSFCTVPVNSLQKEHNQHTKNQSVVLIPSKGTKLSPSKVAGGLMSLVLFIIAGAFLMLGLAARYLDGKSVKSTSWGLYLVQASQLVSSLHILLTG
jgi:hypothetical protein